MMRISKEALTIRVVVRRVGIGSARYRWEIHAMDTAEPVHVSAVSYIGMEAAYSAGQARLADFIPKRSLPPGETENRQWQSRRFGLGDLQRQA